MRVFAVEDAETGATTPRRSSVNCCKSFCGTMIFFFCSLPFLLWVFFILRRLIAQQYDCKSLVNLSDNGPHIAVLVMMFLLIFFFVGAILMERIPAAVGIGLLFAASWLVMADVPKLDSKTTFGGLFGGSKETWVRSNNTSDYWNNNVRSCVCRTSSCEDNVYKSYMYAAQVSFAITKLSATKPAACTSKGHCHRDSISWRDGDGQVMKERSNPNPSPRHHEVCFSALLWNMMGEHKLCYSCDACEEGYLKGLQKNVWQIGNGVVASASLIVLSTLFIFVNELWALCRR